jgi:hypothetical protein
MMNIEIFVNIIMILAASEVDKNLARPNGIWIPWPKATFCCSLAIFSSNIKAELVCSSVP